MADLQTELKMMGRSWLLENIDPALWAICKCEHEGEDLENWLGGFTTPERNLDGMRMRMHALRRVYREDKVEALVKLATAHAPHLFHPTMAGAICVTNPWHKSNCDCEQGFALEMHPNGLYMRLTHGGCEHRPGAHMADLEGFVSPLLIERLGPVAGQ